MESVIEITHLVKNYYLGKQAIQVLKGLELTILKNEYVALMGPSGSAETETHA